MHSLLVFTQAYVEVKLLGHGADRLKMEYLLYGRAVILVSLEADVVDLSKVCCRLGGDR